MTEPRRTTVKPSPLTGWDPAAHTVQVALLDRSVTRHSTYAVYLDGRRVGYVLGRPEAAGDSRSMWDYNDHATVPLRTVLTAHYVYPFTSRRQAVEHLIDTVQRGTTR